MAKPLRDSKSADKPLVFPALIALLSAVALVGLSPRLRANSAPVISERNDRRAERDSLKHIDAGGAARLRDEAREARGLVSASEAKMPADENVAGMMRQLNEASTRFHVVLDTVQPDNIVNLFPGVAPYGAAPYRVGVRGRWEDISSMLHTWSATETTTIPYVRALTADTLAIGGGQMKADIVIALMTKHPTRAAGGTGGLGASLPSGPGPATFSASPAPAGAAR